jgi:fermentation-respiration switch protein FrsA (DUF1100 family)
LPIDQANSLLYALPCPLDRADAAREKRAMSMLFKIVLTAAIAYAGLVLAAWLGQRRLMYFPDPSRISPAAAGLTGVEEHLLDVPDGTRLVTWQAAPRPGQPTLLYLHGNAGGLINRAGRFARYQGLGYGLMAMSYRGYSGSTGSPSERANIDDAILAYEALRQRGVAAENIVVYGESLGSGVAVALAAQRKVGVVVLDAPYTSIVDIAAGQYPFLPVRTLLTDRYESNALIGRVKAPVLILHGARDRIIPVEMGRGLYALAKDPKRLVIFPDGRHVDLDDHGAVQEVQKWVNETRNP